MARRSRRLLCLLLVASICLTALQFTAVDDDTAKKVTDEDVMAGLASPSELYSEIDKTTVPDIIGAEEAVKKGHVKRLYEDEGDNLNQVVFLNADGTKTAYLYDFPVKYTDEKGRIRDISLTLADGNIKGEYMTAAHSE